MYSTHLDAATLGGDDASTNGHVKFTPRHRLYPDIVTLKQSNTIIAAGLVAQSFNPATGGHELWDGLRQKRPLMSMRLGFCGRPSRKRRSEEDERNVPAACTSYDWVRIQANHRVSTPRGEMGGRCFFCQFEPNFPLPYCTVVEGCPAGGLCHHAVPVYAQVQLWIRFTLIIWL